LYLPGDTRLLRLFGVPANFPFLFAQKMFQDIGKYVDTLAGGGVRANLPPVDTK
jgi:hypothetical protein